jgi:UDP-N-acetylglucosamine acyltransferase
LDSPLPPSEIAASAIVSPEAIIGPGCRIGPFCVVGPGAVLDAGVELTSHVILDGIVHLGAGVKVAPFATIGMAPQDLKYKGQPTRVEIGPRTQVREHVTIHRGSVGGDGVTRVGADCLLMVGAHIAHDCTVGDRVILANGAMIAGHVVVGDTVFMGGGAAVHQFVRIGRQAVIGGVTGVERDVIPFGSVMGNRARLIGLNLVGLKRRGFTRPQIHALRAAFRALFRGTGAVFDERVAATEVAFPDDPLVAELIAFIRADSKRGLCRAGRDPDGAEDEAEEA